MTNHVGSEVRTGPDPDNHEPLRVALIGAGWWAIDNHLPALRARDDVRIVAVCRRDPVQLQAVAELFSIPVAVRDIADLPWGDLDAAIVASPHTLHHAHASTCFEHRLHVMCEKPLAVTAADAFDLVRRANEAERTLLVPHGWQFAPAVNDARRWVQQGRVGLVEHVSAVMASPARALFSGEVDSIVGATVQPQPSTWTSDGGGYAFGQLSHLLSLVFWLTGLVPSEVAALSTEGPAGTDIYDAAAIRCRGGALVAVSGAAAVPSAHRHHMELRIYGSEGAMTIDLERDRIEVVREDGRDEAMALDAGALRYDCVEPVRAFCDLALGLRTDNQGDPVCSAYATAALEAALASASSGRIEPVPIP
jgi:predicted dehydrogenase